METKNLVILISINFLIIISVVFPNIFFAEVNAALADIQYPVTELGNCKSEADCKIYCDKLENLSSCIDFAQKHNLMSTEEIEMAKKFLAVGGKGPGGCTSKYSCEEYCNDISHIDECISFAEKNGLIPPEELAEAKKVQAAIQRGVKPPPCGNKKACDVYCEEPLHMEECITFAEAAGFLQGQELEDAKKMLAAVKRGVTPPPCKGKEECDEYCSKPENMELCMNFAIEAGFMTEQEKADAKKMLEAIEKGVMPPNCKGKEECDIYCAEEEHFEECVTFAEAAGFMSAEDAAMARKTGGKGPGGCKGEEECRAFCDNPNNQQICFDFAKEHGLISEEDLKMMEQGRQELQQALSQAPPEVINCLTSLLGPEMVEKLKSGTAMPPKEIGDQMGQCFSQMGPMQGPGGPGEGGMMPAGQTGPGGCQAPEECQAYCQSHPEECQNFQPPAEGFSSPTAPAMPTGPDGCSSPEECQSYCQNNPEACQGFVPQAGELPPTGEYQPPQYQQPPEGTQPEMQNQPAPQLPPAEQQPPAPEPTSLLSPERLLGSIINFFLRLLGQ